MTISSKRKVSWSIRLEPLATNLKWLVDADDELEAKAKLWNLLPYGSWQRYGYVSKEDFVSKVKVEKCYDDSY